MDSISVPGGADGTAESLASRLRRSGGAAARRFWFTAVVGVGHLRAACSYRAVRIACPILVTLGLVPPVYLAAFRSGLTLDSAVPDEPIGVPTGSAEDEVKWIANYDDQFKGRIPARQALAESRNAVAVWIAREVGMDKVIATCRDLGIRSALRPYISTALGASEVRLLELAGAYRAMASGIRAEPHVIARVTDSAGALLYEAPGAGGEIPRVGLALIQEGLRGVIRLPGGTASALSSGDFPVSVMGKTGTTSEFRDALFIGSTYGPGGITVAVRIGFDDNRSLGAGETGGRIALPVFRKVMSRVYKEALVGAVPRIPRAMEDRIDAYLSSPGPEISLPIADLVPRGNAASILSGVKSREGAPIL